MMSSRALLPIACLLIAQFVHCQSGEVAVLPLTAERIDSLRKVFAPDRRVAILDYEIVREGAETQLHGETNLPILYNIINENGWNATRSFHLLPAKTLGRNTLGIVSVSTANIRSEAKHSSELSTQAVLGTPLRIWKQSENWYYVQTPEGYLGWLEDGAFTSFSQQSFREYQAKPKGLYHYSLGLAVAEPRLDSEPVGDLVAGNLVTLGHKMNDFQQIEFPDGRKGYVPVTSITPWTDWLSNQKVTRAQVIETAKSLLGRPYMWGGTSAKAMDCSGFTKTIFYLHGYQLPRDASQQVLTGEDITEDIELDGVQPGDFLFFGRKSNGRERVTHVGLYLGEGRMIHAGDGRVQIQSLVPGTKDYAAKRRSSFLRAKNLIDHLGNPHLPHLSQVEIYKGSNP